MYKRQAHHDAEQDAGGQLGIVMGWLGVQIMKRLSLPASGLYPLATMAWIVFTYGLGELAHGSAFAAVFVCAMILGNAQLPHRHATRSFAEGIGWVAQIGPVSYTHLDVYKRQPKKVHRRC